MNSLSTSARIRAIFSGSIGNLVEWYDWYAYASFYIYFAPVFFPEDDATTQLLNSAGIFAVGFLMRPLGGWLFGSIADRVGRKRAMTLSVLLMSFGSLLIACAPTYASVGVLAPVILFAARMLQGLSVGGEYGTSATYLSEMASSDRRGFFSSFQYVTLIGGLLLALGVQLILQQFLDAGEMTTWGWRIPFAIGAALAITALYLRANMDETEAFKHAHERKANKSGTLRELMKYPKQILLVVGLTLGGTIAFYTYTTYMQKFLVNTVHLSKEQSTQLTFLSLLIYAGLQPLFGILSDKIGRRPLLISFGIFGTLATVPLFYLLSRTSDWWTIFGVMMMLLIIVSGYTSINAVVKAELFPAEIRALGVGFPYSITVALFGGTAEYIALALRKAEIEYLFFWYVSACIFISLLVYIFMRDTKSTSEMDRD